MKNQDFLTKVRLCLCLFFGLTLLGCSVSRPVQAWRTYRVTVTVLPGTDLAAWPGAYGPVIFPAPPALIDRPELLRFNVHIRDEEQLAALRERLNASGIIVQEIVPTNN